MSNNKIGILLRVSSKVQETDGTSLDVQKDLGIKLSNLLGFEPVIFNEGSQSSFKVEINQRIKLVEMLDEIQKKNGIRRIWVFNTDRLGRYSNSWYSILKVFLDYSVELYVGESQKPYDFNNPNDNFSIGILSLVSQYDNELRRLRSVMGKRNSLRNGNTFVGGTIPFGYSLKGRMLVPNVGESKIVKKMFEMYKDGKSTVQIKVYLDTKTEYRPKRSKDGWNLGTIQKMLGNTLYKGFQIWDWKEYIGGEQKIVESIKVKTPQLISDELWDSVQLKLQQNMKNRNVEKVNTSLFDGLLFCKSCKVKLSNVQKKSNPNPLYSCRSVEYKWKNPNKWGKKHSECTLKKSLRIEETDSRLLHHIITLLKESKKVREDFKVKNLSPKFEKVENIKKERNNRTKVLNDKKRYLTKLEDNLVDIEFQIITSQIESNKGKKLIKKISDLISEVDEDIRRLERELKIYTNSTQWIDWLNRMYLEIDSVENLTLEKQKTFINEYIERIDVEYLPKLQSHKFYFEFKYPIIEDEIIIDGVINGKRNYKIKDGSTKSSVSLPYQLSRNLIKKERKNELIKIITELRIEQSLSLSETCEELNKNQILTPTNKLWDKPKLSSFIKNMKVDVGK